MKSTDQIARDVVSQYNAIPNKPNELFFLHDIPREIKDKFRKEFSGKIDQESLLLFIDTTSATSMWGSYKYGALLTNMAVYFIQKDKKSAIPLEEIKNIYLGNFQFVINDEKQLEVSITSQAGILFYNVLCHIFRSTFGEPVECPIDRAIFFPKNCVGCGTTEQLEKFEMPVYGKLRSTAGGSLVQKYALGSALLGGVVFSILLGDLSQSLKKREIKMRYQIQICENCRKTLNKFETDTTSQPLVSDDSINATVFGNRLFSIQATPSKLLFWFRRPEYSSSFLERNRVAFNEAGEPQGLPSDVFMEYKEIFGNSLAEIDAKIVHEWRLNMEPISESEPGWFYASQLPQKTIDEARLKYPEIQPKEHLIALEQTNLLGFKRIDIVVTTKGFYWPRGGKNNQFLYVKVPPESIHLKEGFLENNLLYGDGLDFPITLFSTSGIRDHHRVFVTFLANACRIARGG